MRDHVSALLSLHSLNGHASMFNTARGSILNSRHLLSVLCQNVGALTRTSTILGSANHLKQPRKLALGTGCDCCPTLRALAAQQFLPNSDYTGSALYAAFELARGCCLHSWRSQPPINPSARLTVVRHHWRYMTVRQKQYPRCSGKRMRIGILGRGAISQLQGHLVTPFLLNLTSLNLMMVSRKPV